MIPAAHSTDMVCPPTATRLNARNAPSAAAASVQRALPRRSAARAGTVSGLKIRPASGRVLSIGASPTTTRRANVGSAASASTSSAAALLGDDPAIDPEIAVRREPRIDTTRQAMEHGDGAIALERRGRGRWSSVGFVELETCETNGAKGAHGTISTATANAHREKHCVVRWNHGGHAMFVQHPRARAQIKN